MGMFALTGSLQLNRPVSKAHRVGGTTSVDPIDPSLVFLVYFHLMRRKKTNHVG